MTIIRVQHDDSADATATVQSAIDTAAPGDTVLIDGTYNIDAERSVNMTSDITLEMTQRSALQPIPTGHGTYAVVNVVGCENVTIRGGTIRGERYQHTGQQGEFGHAIQVIRKRVQEEPKVWKECKNICIEDVAVTQCWGDGICVEGAINVTINRVRSHDNRRQGLSVIQVDTLKVMNSVFEKINGTMPAAGIDLEAEPGKWIQNVLIEHNRFLRTDGSNIAIGDPNGTYRNI